MAAAYGFLSKPAKLQKEWSVLYISESKYELIDVIKMHLCRVYISGIQNLPYKMTLQSYQAIHQNLLLMF